LRETQDVAPALEEWRRAYQAAERVRAMEPWRFMKGIAHCRNEVPMNRKWVKRIENTPEWRKINVAIRESEGLGQL
jgi:hypothetical protein